MRCLCHVMYNIGENGITKVRRKGIYFWGRKLTEWHISNTLFLKFQKILPSICKIRYYQYIWVTPQRCNLFLYMFRPYLGKHDSVKVQTWRQITLLQKKVFFLHLASPCSSHHLLFIFRLVFVPGTRGEAKQEGWNEKR